jgi:hypothetical protein
MGALTSGRDGSRARTDLVQSVLSLVIRGHKLTCTFDTRLIAVFAVACINLNVAAAIAIPTAAWVNFLWDELAHVLYKRFT